MLRRVIHLRRSAPKSGMGSKTLFVPSGSALAHFAFTQRISSKFLRLVFSACRFLKASRPRVSRPTATLVSETTPVYGRRKPHPISCWYSRWAKYQRASRSLLSSTSFLSTRLRQEGGTDDQGSGSEETFDHEDETNCSDDDDEEPNPDSKKKGKAESQRSARAVRAGRAVQSAESDSGRGVKLGPVEGRSRSRRGGGEVAKVKAELDVDTFGGMEDGRGALAVPMGTQVGACSWDFAQIWSTRFTVVGFSCWQWINMVTFLVFLIDLSHMQSIDPTRCRLKRYMKYIRNITLKTGNHIRLKR